jgi:tetratricopeptide (TPR) repeat protein
MQRHGLPLHAAYCQLFSSWAQRDTESMRQTLGALLGAGLELGKTQYQGLLAELEFDAGRHDAALEIAEELSRWGRGSGEHYMLSELLRLKSQCLRVRGEHEAAEASLREALSIARKQGAKMLELKALTALGELLREQGRAAEVHELLSSQVQGFTEGLEAPELVQARELLRALTV